MDGEIVQLDRPIKAEEKVRRYAGCMVGDKVRLVKSVGNIKAGTEVEILSIRCNDKQRLRASDLEGSHIEVSKNTFQYKIDKDTWTTCDKLDINIKIYKPQISNCIAELIVILVLLIIFIVLSIMRVEKTKASGLIAIASGYLAIALFMNLYEAKLKTNGTELKLVKNTNNQKNTNNKIGLEKGKSRHED